MEVKLLKKLAGTITLLVLLCATSVRADDQDQPGDPIERVHSDVDESSCICGLNKDILDRLENIIKISYNNNDSSQCKSTPQQPSWITQGTIGAQSRDPQSTDSQSRDPQSTDPQSTNPQSRDPPQDDGHKDEGNGSPGHEGTPGTTSSSSGPSAMNQVPYENFRPNFSLDQQKDRDPSKDQQNLLEQLANQYQAQLASLQQHNVGYNPNTMRPPQGSYQPQENNGQNSNPSGYTISPDRIPYDWQMNHLVPNSYQQQQGQRLPPSADFLQGLLGSGAADELAKLNQSQKVDSSDMQSALESTIPNLVSSIFSNIQNIAIQTENNSSHPPQSSDGNSGGTGGSPNVLTSIDGSSVQLNGNSTEQITAKGEELFMQWVEHQLQILHLTASTANYIRKSALNLFRRIVKQYVERIERLGGRVEDNVKRATQIALNNTENLIAFILRNYINFAGGLMQIIGESVSRFGKKIDSTGETIANVNLNPFDMVSDVIDSLPNPSRYSEYFRAFGKYIMGESSSTPNSSNDASSSNDGGQQEQQQASNSQPERPKGLFSKAIGSLSKTFSWMG